MQAACGNKYNSINNNCVDKMQQKRANIVLQSTLGKLIGKQEEDDCGVSRSTKAVI